MKISFDVDGVLTTPQGMALARRKITEGNRVYIITARNESTMSARVYEIAKELGIPFLGRIPLDINIRIESDAGTPPALGEGPISDAYSAIAQRVATWIDSPKDTVA